MKNVLFIASFAVLAILCGCCATEKNVCQGKNCETKCCKRFTAEQKEEMKMSMEKTYKFIKEAGHYFIATADKDQPRVRPFGTIHIFENKLYIQTGRKKNVGQQLLANGNVELCAMKGNEWIRVSGLLIDDNRREAKASLLEEYESLKSMYSADDDNTMVLFFKPGTVTATIHSFSNEPIVMKF